MGIQLKQFFDKQPKLRNGHVRDILEMSEQEKDEAVVAFLRDDSKVEAARLYPTLSNDGKNYTYGNVERHLRDAIDSYNKGVDLDIELAGDVEVSDDELTSAGGIYDDWDESGHGRGDFC